MRHTVQQNRTGLKPDGRKTRRPGQEQAALRQHPRPSMGNIITTTPNVRAPLLLGVAMLLIWMPSTSLLALPGALAVPFRVFVRQCVRTVMR